MSRWGYVLQKLLSGNDACYDSLQAAASMRVPNYPGATLVVARRLVVPRSEPTRTTRRVSSWGVKQTTIGRILGRSRSEHALGTATEFTDYFALSIATRHVLALVVQFLAARQRKLDLDLALGKIQR